MLLHFDSSPLFSLNSKQKSFHKHSRFMSLSLAAFVHAVEGFCLPYSSWKRLQAWIIARGSGGGAGLRSSAFTPALSSLKHRQPSSFIQLGCKPCRADWFDENIFFNVFKVLLPTPKTARECFSLEYLLASEKSLSIFMSKPLASGEMNKLFIHFYVQRRFQLDIIFFCLLDNRNEAKLFSPFISNLSLSCVSRYFPGY